MVQQDRWSLVAVVFQDGFYCIQLLEYRICAFITCLTVLFSIIYTYPVFSGD